METKICLECGNEFEKPYNCSKKNWVGVKFCCRACKQKSILVRNKISGSQKGKPREYSIGHIVSEETRNKIGLKNKGHIVTDKTRNKISESLLKLGIKRPYRKNEWISKWNKEHNHLRRGKRRSFYGDPKNDTELRRRVEYIEWRSGCKERDNYTCQKTKIIGGELQVHHIFNFSKYPELRFEINNGITLSKESHKEFHRIYGRKNNTKEQLIEFLNN